MRKRTTVGLVATAVAGATIAAMAPAAIADTSAQGNDAVIVGSDTLQFAGDFVTDGDAAGDTGYNSGTFNRAFDYFASGDANGRFTVAGGVAGAPSNGAETIVLRAGTKPVARVNGSGAGIGSLLSDVTGTGYRGLPLHSINAARASRLPNSAEKTACDANAACGGYHVYEIGNDTLTMAKAASGSNATGSFTADQLWNIYNCTAGYTHWNDTNIFGAGASANTIIPVIPQSGSGTRNFFLATIDAASGHGTDPSLGSCVKTGEEHDPSGITQSTSPADTIEPFSTARLTMINTNLFFNNSGTAAGTPATGFTAGAVTTAGGFSTVRGVYIVIREADRAIACSAVTTPTCSKPGGTRNWVNELISGSATSMFRSSAFSSNIAAAGFTPKYQDCGIDPDDSATSTNVCVTNP